MSDHHNPIRPGVAAALSHRGLRPNTACSRLAWTRAIFRARISYSAFPLGVAVPVRRRAADANRWAAGTRELSQPHCVLYSRQYRIKIASSIAPRRLAGRLNTLLQRNIVPARLSATNTRQSMRIIWKWLLLIALLSVPGGAWAFYKPIRLLAPELIGLTCLRDTICLNDTSRSFEAEMLYVEALHSVSTLLGQLKHHPRVVFCTTDICAQSFGLDRSTARTTAFGIVIGPRGWLPHYIRHEMIHHLQRERLGPWKLGPLAQWRSPDWFIEGMAYELSQDPRPVLEEPYQQYRSRFQAWYHVVGREHLWEAAEEL